MAANAPVEFGSVAELQAHLDGGKAVAGTVFQGLDLLAADIDRALQSQSLAGCTFLGCDLTKATAARAAADGAVVFPRFIGLPFNPYRGTLYTSGQIYDGYQPGGNYATDSFDGKVYNWYKAAGGDVPADIRIALAERIHDHSITDALEEALEGREVVAIMGGHKLSRKSTAYRQIVLMAKRLAEHGFLVISGGGPGAMEAAHLGARLAGYEPGNPVREAALLDDVLKTFGDVDGFTPYEAWIDSALAVKEKYPRKPGTVESLSIPTWFYGHEPPNVFPDQVAKYFANHVREDGLLAVANSGVIFAEGSAGTTQEIFQDAAQNYYANPGRGPCPMILFDAVYWTQTRPVWPLLSVLAAEKFPAHIMLTTSVDLTVQRILDFRATGGAEPLKDTSPFLEVAPASDPN